MTRFWEKKEPLNRGLLALLLWSAVSVGPACASPSLWGDTGLIAAPSDQIGLDGRLSLGYTRTLGPGSFESAPVPNNVYFINLSLLPRVEFVLIYNQVITGVPDNDLLYLKESSIDRSLNIKVQVLREAELAKWTPNIVIGARDPAGNSDTNPVLPSAANPSGIIAFHSRAYYGVIGKTVAGWHVDAGYALGPQSQARPYVPGNKDFRLRGIFGGIESPPLYGLLRGMAEYDSQRLNLGASIGPFWGFNLKPVLIELTHFSIGASWTVNL